MIGPRQPRPRGRLRRESAARRLEQAVRRGIVAEIGRRPCALRILNVCTGQAEAFHELVGAAQGGSRIDPANLCPACNRCNSIIEDRPALAYEKGWKVRREHAVPGNGGLIPARPNPYALSGGWDA